jgi:hypothetical protein
MNKTYNLAYDHHTIDTVQVRIIYGHVRPDTVTAARLLKNFAKSKHILTFYDLYINGTIWVQYKCTLNTSFFMNVLLCTYMYRFSAKELCLQFFSSKVDTCICLTFSCDPPKHNYVRSKMTI